MPGSMEQCAPGGSLSYAYYPAGNVARVESVAGVTAYTNDNLERVSVIGSAVGQFTFGYNAWNGQVETITYPNGMTARYGYDEMDRATNIVFRDGQGNLVRSQALGFDAAGMITTNRLSDGSGLVEDRRYGYDGLDRLSGETVLDATGGVTRAASWNYDLAGNRLSQIADGSNTTYTYTQANRLTAWTGGSAAFDAAGCVTNLQYPDGRVLSLTWNSRYQLTAVATNGGQAESYGHDALGRRVWTASAGVTNFFVYDGAQVVADVDAAGNMLRSYVWGPTSTGSGQAGIDNLLSMTTYVGTTNTYYAIKDHLGSVLALVDGNGQVVEQYRYDAWGRVLSVKDGSGSALSCSALGARYLWQGREYSWSTGLYNFRARWYDPITGRWLSNDPIGISGGLNQYVFCANNPVNLRDPLGLTDLNLHSPGRKKRNSASYNPQDRLTISAEGVDYGSRTTVLDQRLANALTGHDPNINASELAGLIKRLPRYTSDIPVELVICYVGKGGESSIAAEVSKYIPNVVSATAVTTGVELITAATIDGKPGPTYIRVLYHNTYIPFKGGKPKPYKM